MYTARMNLDYGPLNDLEVGGLENVPEDAYGFEIELEGENIRSMSAKLNDIWAIHPDNSLRAHAGDCLEYVFRKPYTLKDTESAIDLLFDFLNTGKAKVTESYRTSIHVHINMAKETYRTIFNFITLCLIFDELLVSQNGDHRIGNNFCLRARDAVGQVVELIESIQKGHMIFGIHKNNRYSSINFASLLKFGTVEFRSLECTTHKGRVMHWINTLTALKTYSKTFKNPTEIVQKFSQLGPQLFISRALGPFAMKYQQVQGFEEMLHSGMRLAQDFAYCSNWTNADEPEVKSQLEPPKPLKKTAKTPYGPNLYWNHPAPLNPHPQWAVAQALQQIGAAQGQPQGHN